jgi:hypothetical protein
MTRLRTTTVACGIAAGVVLLTAPLATAAPKKGSVFAVTCPGLGTFNVTTPPGNGRFTPAFRSTQVFIPYRVTGTVTVAGQVVDQFDDVKPAPVPGNAISCTFQGTFVDGGVTATVAGTALVAPTGRRG